MSKPEEWYVIKLTSGQCAVLSTSQIQANNLEDPIALNAKRWGPFDSQADAIAHRVGLIRAGKCTPA
uniref:DDE transposase family protein n=1 Tax=Oscillatoriales cyanobacterium SpSt-402 TaxID=2282168 RepID=A0A832M285_9CYAN